MPYYICPTSAISIFTSFCALLLFQIPTIRECCSHLRTEFSPSFMLFYEFKWIRNVSILLRHCGEYASITGPADIISNDVSWNLTFLGRSWSPVTLRRVDAMRDMLGLCNRHWSGSAAHLSMVRCPAIFVIVCSPLQTFTEMMPIIAAY